jgi:hypothetical protein
MKTNNSFSTIFQDNKLDVLQLNIIRGGISGGKGIPIDEDILIPDPEPEE